MALLHQWQSKNLDFPSPPSFFITLIKSITKVCWALQIHLFYSTLNPGISHFIALHVIELHRCCVLPKWSPDPPPAKRERLALLRSLLFTVVWNWVLNLPEVCCTHYRSFYWDPAPPRLQYCVSLLKVSFPLSSFNHALFWQIWLSKTPSDPFASLPVNPQMSA